MTVLTDRDEAVFKITFADETKLPMEVVMSEFIEAKSPKAKGKRFSTLDIAKIEDITPAPEEVEVEGSGESAETNEETTSMMVGDVPLTIDNSVPENSKPVEEQLSLF